MRVLLLICLLLWGTNSFELKAQSHGKNKESISPYVSPILSKAIAVVETHLDSLKQKKKLKVLRIKNLMLLSILFLNHGDGNIKLLNRIV